MPLGLKNVECDEISKGITKKAGLDRRTEKYRMDW